MTDSYKNYNTTEYGDINGNGSEEPLIIEMNTGEGFKPIGNVEQQEGTDRSGAFQGTFDGRGHTLNNIYENREKNSSLFSYTRNAVIKNVNINGTLISTKSIAGGIVAYGESGTQVENCINEAMINGVYAGGIVGETVSNQIIRNCINKGNVIAEKDAGGIIGECSLYSGGNRFDISYSYNIGTIESKENYAAGLIGRYSDGTAKSCYNVGNITTKGNNYKGPLVGYTFATTTEFLNCFYIKGDYGISQSKGVEKEEQEMKTQDFVDLLNENQEKVVWKMDLTDKNNGYPVFE